MGTLILTRHGETPWHAENRYAGSTDIGLTDHGKRQAQRLAAWASNRRIDAVACSALRRACATARPVADALGIESVVDYRLREVDFGAGEGLTRTEMARKFPEALDAFLAAPASCPLPGGERGVDAVARAWPAVAELAARGGSTLIVAHSTLLRLLLCRILGLPLDDYRRRFPELRSAALTTVELTGAADGALLGMNVPLD